MAVTAGAPAHMWFVKTGGEVWGPYPEDRIAAFAREGRVRPTTLLSPFAQGPWSPAADSAEFAAQLRRDAPASTPAPTPAPAPGPVRAAVEPQTPTRAQSPRADPIPASSMQPLLVFAQLTSVAPAAFQAALMRLGPCVQVRSDLWLIRTGAGASALRNLLSAHLAAGDSLLVVEAPLERAAWFNLAAGQDRELRRLWAGG